MTLVSAGVLEMLTLDRVLSLVRFGTGPLHGEAAGRLSRL